MYFLELLEKLDDMKEKPGFPPSLLSFFFFFLTFNVLIDQNFKDECTISRAIPLLLPPPPPYGDFILQQ